MFGYIKPFKPDLRIYEFSYYKSIYCSLCREIKENFGTLYTLGLNYDFVFLSLLKMSLMNEKDTFVNSRCTFNPLQKKYIMKNESITFSSYVFILATKYKLYDDKLDNDFRSKMISNFTFPFVNIKYKLILDEFEYFYILDKVFRWYTLKQKYLENKKVSNIDLISHPSSVCYANILRLISNDSNHSRILYRMGYFLGRWIYLIDAIDDLSNDLKNNNYNPFIYKYNLLKKDNINFNDIYNESKLILNLTLGELINSYNLLNIKYNKEILDNIIFLGLKNIQDNILKGDKTNGSI